MCVSSSSVPASKLCAATARASACLSEASPGQTNSARCAFALAALLLAAKVPRASACRLSVAQEARKLCTAASTRVGS
jgi:hypothetical protein